MERYALTTDRHGDGYGAIFPPVDQLATAGAWRLIRRHEGFLPPAVHALQVRRTGRGADA